MRRSLVVGNWKMHGSKSGITGLIDGIKTGLSEPAAAVAVCPPALYISQVADSLAGSVIAWGAQNLCDQPQGAFTGEISADMLADLGCRYVIVGHSERRALFGESDELIAAKFRAALECDITPILCVGESLEQREAGEALSWIEGQLTSVIDSVGIEAFARGVVAYEPIWAIGTGKTATPEQAQEVHAHIRGVLAAHSEAVATGMQILYGGSVKAANARELFVRDDIDGALVGGASLQAEEFVAIVNAATDVR